MVLNLGEKTEGVMAEVLFLYRLNKWRKNKCNSKLISSRTVCPDRSWRKGLNGEG